jgi:hypothetical protein
LEVWSYFRELPDVPDLKGQVVYCAGKAGVNHRAQSLVALAYSLRSKMATQARVGKLGLIIFVILGCRLSMLELAAGFAHRIDVASKQNHAPFEHSQNVGRDAEQFRRN